ncbi:hypothetical protein BDP27DRAFT_1433620 [Rhodocollybia butyracea]|uniref:Uncharacterized protein n=1 Tax=Rhodocollybia butyracea TaxID=206335 RepID=A0A9P5P716_9AGAR|nr:hypothetical protein BDP27DRAFT_1433620 [Rhodocollybia butyracea]
MPSFSSLPTDITTEILRFYVHSYLVPSFDTTRIPANDSTALESRRLSQRKELLNMLTVCKTFAAVLPPLIFQRVNLFSTRAVVKFYTALCACCFITGHFARSLTYIEFSFSLGSPSLPVSIGIASCIGDIIQRAPNVRCVAFSFNPTCPLFVSRLLTFVRNHLASHVSAIILRLEIANLPLSLPDLYSRVIWGDRTWPVFFASIPHVTDVTFITMQYIVWPPFPCIETAMMKSWLANASPVLQCLHLHYGHHALRHLTLGTYLAQVQTGAVTPPDTLPRISCGFTCTEWRRCNTRFRRDQGVFPAATSAPEYARLFIFGKSLSFS